MKGLIIKDLLFIKSTWKFLIIMFIGSLLISVALGNYLLAICVLPVMLLSSGINTFQTDEFYNTDSYILSFPLSRKKIVLSKYIFTLIVLLVSTYIGLMLYFFIYLIIHPGFNGLNTDMIKQLLMLEFSAVFVNSVFYPVIYKFGCEKSRLVLLSIVMLLLGIVSIASVYINTQNVNLDFEFIVNTIQTYGVYVLGVFVSICLVISYFLSILFYKRKDY
ncbi:MAG: ABC-2 transporter permease [Bacilli bacterium]|nr:ABC-2 transporter permease [Bacilli bacterium]